MRSILRLSTPLLALALVVPSAGEAQQAPAAASAAASETSTIPP